MAVFEKKGKKLNKNLLKELEELYQSSDNSLDIFYPIFPIVEIIPV